MGSTVRAKAARVVKELELLDSAHGVIKRKLAERREKAEQETVEQVR